MKTSEKRSTKKCERCEKDFYVKPSHMDRAKYCSWECRTAKGSVIDMKTLMATVENKPLTPQQSAQIRSNIAQYVKDQIVIANEVVMHGKEWTPTQARVFGMLLNKVVPDLNAAYHKHEHEIKNLTEMSRAELEQNASGAKQIEGEYVEDVN